MPAGSALWVEDGALPCKWTACGLDEEGLWKGLEPPNTLSCHPLDDLYLLSYFYVPVSYSHAQGMQSRPLFRCGEVRSSANHVDVFNFMLSTLGAKPACAHFRRHNPLFTRSSHLLHPLIETARHHAGRAARARPQRAPRLLPALGRDNKGGGEY